MSVHCKIISTFIFVNIGIKKRWIKNPRTSLRVDLHNNRAIGMFSLFLVYFPRCVMSASFLSTAKQLSLCSQKHDYQDLHRFTSYRFNTRERLAKYSFCFQIQISRRKDSLTQLGSGTHFWIKQLWPGGQGDMKKRHLFRKHEINN